MSIDYGKYNFKSMSKLMSVGKDKWFSEKDIKEYFKSIKQFHNVLKDYLAVVVLIILFSLTLTLEEVLFIQWNIKILNQY